MQRVLVTGSNGFLGSQLVRELLNAGYSVLGLSLETSGILQHKQYTYLCCDMTNLEQLEKVFMNFEISRVIHLAAIAHVSKGEMISWDRYYRINTMMSRQIFEISCALEIPVFFSSTIDVYGITNKIVDEKSEPDPIGSYAKSKYQAEKYLLRLAKQPYLIARFAPIYSETNHKDIEKRCYVHFPGISYRIGNGLAYEFLSIQKAMNLILDWCDNPGFFRGIMNVCDDERMDINTLIEKEQKQGRAKVVIKIPQLLANSIHSAVRICFKHKPLFVFNLSKIMKPIKISRI